MITISKLANLFGISPQTVRMYERYHVIKTDRDSANNYRRFDLNSFTDLIKARILQGLGFSMKDVSLLMNRCDIQDTKLLMNRQKAKLQEEIDSLKRKYMSLGRMLSQIDEIMEKQGTCEIVEEDGWYVQPVLTQDDVLFFPDHIKSSPWNTFAYIRQDINLLYFDQGMENCICFACSESDAKTFGLNLSDAEYFPPRSYLKAYFIVDSSDHFPHSRENLGFALAQLKKMNARLCGPILLFLPYTSGSRNGIYYHYALLPFEPSA